MTIVRSVRISASPARVVPVIGGPPGPAGMVWRGTFDTGATYVKLDGVSYAGASYICTTAVGPTATTPDADAAHWDLLAKAGIDGTGTVNSVNGVAPDGTGNVPLTPANIGAATTAQGSKADTAVQPARAVSTAAGSGLLGGGDLSANRALSVDFGISAGKVPQGNDSRFVGVPVSTQTAAYTLVAADAGSIVEVNSASAVNVTVPASTFAAGQIVEVCQYGAGQVTIAAGSGVTLRNAGGLKISAQYGSASIRFRSATEAVVSGSMTT